MATTCPNTKIVLGGFSQGAAVAGYITADAVPPGFTLPQGITGPMPVRSLTTSPRWRSSESRRTASSRSINTAAPPITVGSLYSAKTLDLCIPADPICSPGGGDNGAHNLYPVSGMTDQAATYAAQHVSADNSASSH